MTLTPGARIGPYELVDPIGSGGMGTVYRARDERLNRDVALKVMPAAMAADPDRLRRFTLEAQATGALNHPNILAIHDIGTVDGHPYLVSELLDGETLRERLDRGRIPASKAIDYARQTASGLAAAHARGITHRDIKPENLFLTTDGRVKILDFGIARVTGGASDAGETRTSLSTDAGVILGTAAYMSPEQVRGLVVDPRSDLFSLGVVLYEMLAGARPFSGGSTVETMNAILTADPPELGATAATLTPDLDRIVRHCLEKNADERFQSARDLAFQLSALTGSGVERRVPTDGVAPPSVPPRPTRARAAMLAFVLGGGVTIGVLAAVWWWRSAPAAAVPRIEVLTYSGADRTPAASPDGKLIAFSSSRNGRAQIWLKQIDGGAETVRTTGPADVAPRFSPDGATLLFLRDTKTGFTVFRAPVLGTDEQRVVDGAMSADWSPDGTRIAFSSLTASGFALSHVRFDGSDRRELRTYADDVPLSVRWSPDGARLAVVLVSRTSVARGSRIEIVSVDGGVARSLGGASIRVVMLGSNPAWISPHELVYATGRGVLDVTSSRVVRHDVDSDRVETLLWTLRQTVTVDVVADGTLVMDAADSIAVVRDVPFDGAATGTVLMRSMSLDREPMYAPDGSRVVFASSRSGNLDLWTMDIGDRSMRRLTDDPATDWDPAFTADGRSIVWSSNRSGNFEIWMANADGSGARQVSHDGEGAENPSITPDGRWIVYTSGGVAKRGIWRVRPDGRDAAPVASGTYVLPEASPDGQLVAFLSDWGPTHRRILVHRIDDGAPVPFEIQVPRFGAADASFGRLRWMPDGKRIVFQASDAAGTTGLFVQDVVIGRDTSATRRRLGGFFPDAPVESFGIAPDGQSAIVTGVDSRSDLVLVTGVGGVARPRPNR
jgi:Tol biopolymer transport system component